jgi:membrane protein implicated in regulation of membrane protease activity
MSEFFAKLTPEHLYVGCAVFGGTLFVVRIILMLVGAAGAEADGADVADAGDVADTDGDADLAESESGADTGMKILTIQGFTAFVMMFGLTGFAITKASTLSVSITFVISIGAGVFTMWLMAKLFRAMLAMQSSGSATLSSAVGKQGNVYLTVPPGGIGKVHVDIGGHLKVVDASCESDEELKTGDRIEVVKSIAGNTLVVRKV